MPIGKTVRCEMALGEAIYSEIKTKCYSPAGIRAAFKNTARRTPT